MMTMTYAMSIAAATPHQHLRRYAERLDADRLPTPVSSRRSRHAREVITA
jgi:hypothetical protein